MNRIDLLMNQAIAEGVFPGGVLLAAEDGAIRWFKAYGVSNRYSNTVMTQETVFDLASLTKPLATTLAAMLLVQRSKLDLDQRIDTILPAFEDSPKGGITVRHLLAHTSGLPDYRPYYKELAALPPEKRRPALRDRLVKEPLEAPIGKETRYSDLGFMVLCWIIETVSEKRMDRMVAEDIYLPLALDRLFFPSADNTVRSYAYAATENCPWRGKILEGEVHDDNAYVVGGVEGHAGLFGAAHDIFRLLSVLLDTYGGLRKTGLFEPDILRSFLNRAAGADRVLGFDMPSKTDSSSGHHFSDHTVGHLGFTGTSFWMDLKQRIIVILLTNRVHPSRENQTIRDFRPRLHDTVMVSLREQGLKKDGRPAPPLSGRL